METTVLLSPPPIIQSLVKTLTDSRAAITAILAINHLTHYANPYNRAHCATYKIRDTAVDYAYVRLRISNRREVYNNDRFVNRILS